MMAAIISGFGGQPSPGSVAFKVRDGLDVGDGWHSDLAHQPKCHAEVDHIATPWREVMRIVDNFSTSHALT